ncbi:hypothetical protein BDZ94DRAFT_101065 [Collybia nuda]|uniref:Uncharacterized protein n=1 Tax=Collybia nuda TaxID=64659 RepID=A0A9P5XXD2_9AGAR|nr:hypothetical protein BDZ94DRAFT_101065 [Collybia nuda]
MGRSGRPFDKLSIERWQIPFPPDSCKRCEYIFEYPEDAPLDQIIQVVYEHQRSCFSGPRLLRNKEVTNANEGYIREGEDLPPATTKRTRNTQQVPPEPHKRRKKNVMDEKTRRLLIERDSWGRNATSKSVECRGCGKTIKLDKRSQYYPGLWHKHRNKCPEIQRLAAQGGKVTNALPETSIGDQQAPTRESTPPSADESISEKSATRERVLRWAATLGPQYEVVTSHPDTPRIFEQQSDANSIEDVVARIKRPVHASNSPIITTISIWIGYSDEASNWRKSLSESGRDDNQETTLRPEEPEEKRRRNRYLSKRECIKTYKGGTFMDKQGVAFSEDVIQAALCLVSMKSRTSVS